jgi:hypothetical protein
MKEFDLCMILALVQLEIVAEKINVLKDKLNQLDKNKSGSVTIDLTKSNLRVHFVKVLGKWGAMTENGDWSPLENIPFKTIEKMLLDVTNVL